MNVVRRALIFVALGAPVPLAILSACGSTNFTGGSDQDAGTIDPPDVATTEPVGSWCSTYAPSALLCADFDEPNPDVMFVKGMARTGVLSLGPNPAPAGSHSISASTDSPPSALSFSLGPSADGGPSGINLQGSLSQVRTNVQLNLDINLQEFATDGSTESAASIDILLTSGTADDVVYELLVGGGPATLTIHTNTLVASTLAETVALGPTPPVGVWTHLALDIVTGDGGVVTAQLGANPSVTTLSSHFPETGGLRPLLLLGISSSGGMSTSSIGFDNVVLSTRDTDAGDAGDAGDGG